MKFNSLIQAASDVGKKMKYMRNANGDEVTYQVTINLFYDLCEENGTDA